MAIYTVREEALRLIEQYQKACVTIRKKHADNQKQADRAIQGLMEDKFGSDCTFEVLVAELAANEFDKIVGRSRQADRVRGERNARVRAAKQKLLDELTLQYCGSAA